MSQPEDEDDLPPPIEATPLHALLALVGFVLLVLWGFDIICMNCPKG